MCVHTLLAAPLAQVLTEPDVLVVVADRGCLALDLLAGDLLGIGQPDVAEAVLVAHLGVYDEEPGAGHAHLLDEHGDPIEGAVRSYLHELTDRMSLPVSA